MQVIWSIGLGTGTRQAIAMRAARDDAVLSGYDER